MYFEKDATSTQIWRVVSMNLYTSVTTHPAAFVAQQQASSWDPREQLGSSLED